MISILQSLQKTYENDATTKAKIDWLLDSVNKTIKDHTIIATSEVDVFMGST